MLEKDVSSYNTHGTYILEKGEWQIGVCLGIGILDESWVALG